MTGSTHFSGEKAELDNSADLLMADRVAATAPHEADAFSQTFRHQKVTVDGVSIHFVIGGSGPPILLLHGWPGTWLYWRRLMPTLAEHYTVIAVDMPGFGDSQPAADARKVTVSALLRRLMDQIGHSRVSLVSHDMGGTVAYAYAAQFPGAVEKVVFTETAIPGFGFADGSAHDLLQLTPQSAAGIWHFAFFMKPGMAEMLVRGRERELIYAMAAESYTNPEAFSDEEAEALTRWISSPNGLTNGLAYYRALFADAEDNSRLAVSNLEMPVLVLNGGDGFLQYAAPQSVRSIAQHVQESVVPASGHFIAMERPRFLARTLLEFLGAAS
jgi:pimeloyl-ACP methyl ester carboxylesterase